MATPPPLTPYQLSVAGENKGPTVVGVSAAMLSLSTVAVTLRFIARKSRHASYGLDDWLAIGALVFVILFCVTCIISVPYGLGRHTWATDPTQVYKVIEIGLFNALIYAIVHGFIKLSILAFYKRVFTFREIWFKWCVLALGFYSLGWSISVFFVALFQCTPIRYFWERYNPAIQPPLQGFCTVVSKDLVLSTSALNSVGDILIFSLPIVRLWQLQLRRGPRIALVAVFATGAVAVAAGLVRLSKTVDAIAPNADATWVAADIYMWTAVEASVGLTCACLPSIGALGGLLKTHWNSYLSKRSSRKALFGPSNDQDESPAPTARVGRYDGHQDDSSQSKHQGYTIEMGDVGPPSQASDRT